MKIYNEHITLQTTKTREVVNITTQVKAAMEKSGLREGIIVVSSLHANSAVIVNDEETGLREDLDQWLKEIAPVRDDFKHQGRFESNAAIHFQSLLLGHQIIAPFSEGRSARFASKSMPLLSCRRTAPNRSDSWDRCPRTSSSAAPPAMLEFPC
jgi:secondary thiamine-phosphate synthase enzyme